MPTNSYDLIVVGDDLPGLVAATLCARRGLRTLLVGREDHPARYQLGPFRLPVEPGVLPGRGAGAAARVVRELGLDHALKRRLRDVRVTAQLVGPDVRVDLAAEDATQAREIERELPAAAEDLLALWQRAGEVAHAADALLVGDDAFPGVGFFERRDVARQTARVAELAAAWWRDVEACGDPAMIAALTRLPAAAGGRVIDPPPAAVARALELWRQGAPSLRGDGTGLRELLLDKLTAANGEVRTATVTELHQGWSKINAVRLASGEELGASQVVAALPVDELCQLLGKKPPRRLTELAAEQRRAGWRYVLNLVVDAAAVPEGMAPTVLCVVDPEQPLAGANGFALHAGEADDQGRVVVTAAALLPAGDDDGEPDPEWLAAAAARLRADLLDRIEQVMPFAEHHLVVLHSPHEATAPLAGGGGGSHEVGRGLPAAMMPVWHGTLDGSGLVGAPYATGIKNLTLASSQVLPTLGLEGDLVVGWSAARVACTIAGKKRDYLRDEVVNA